MPHDRRCALVSIRTLPNGLMLKGEVSELIQSAGIRLKLNSHEADPEVLRSGPKYRAIRSIQSFRRG